MRSFNLLTAALVGCLLGGGWGCQDRTRSRVDGVEPRGDGGPAPDGGPMPDAGSDAALPDALAFDRSPPDAAADATPDAAADATPDAEPAEPDLYGRATAHHGRAGCPVIDTADRGWRVAAAIAHHGEALGERVAITAVDRDNGPGEPDDRGTPDGGRIEALRWADGALFAAWRPQPGGALRAGWGDDRQPYGVDPLPAGQPLVALPEAIDAARIGGSNAALLPGDDELVLIIDGGGAAAPAVVTLPAEGVRRARLIGHADGWIVGWSDGQQLEVIRLDARGERIDARLIDVAGPGFDMASSADALAVVYIAPDPRLAGLDFAGGYGRPTLDLSARVDAPAGRTIPLTIDPIRGADPAIGAGSDGWLTAWVRLRVDGDRNRTEIEANVVGPDGPGRPQPITRAHGFSFCPAVGGAIDGRSLIAWMDTRDGREEVFTAVGDFADWPIEAPPEPTPAPPDFADGCDLGVRAMPELIGSLHAVPDGDGFMAVWTDRAFGVSAGRLTPDGPELRWQWTVESPRGRPLTEVKIARAPGGWVVFGEEDGRIRGWRLDRAALGGPMPIAPPGIDGDFGVALHAVAGGEAGVVLVSGAAQPAARRLEGGQPVIPLPGAEGRIAAAASADGFAIAWPRYDPDPAPGEPVVDIGLLELPAAGPWGEARARFFWDDRYAEPDDIAPIATAGGWRLLLTAHRGRSYARAVLDGAFDGDPPTLRPLDLDPASSLFAVGHGGATLWSEIRPIQRFQIHYRPAGGPVERLPIRGELRDGAHLTEAGGDPVVLWRAGAEARIARVPARCRLPAATAP